MSAKTRRLLIASVAAAALLGGCNFTSGLELRNLTAHTLTPYLVVTDPPPPHRAAHPNGAVPMGGSTPIDPAGFNPVFYAPGVNDPDRANGIYIGLALLDADPLQIQYRVYHYPVPPGQAGQNPALQPVLLHEGVEELPDVDVRITVTQPPDLSSNPPPGGWDVDVAPK